MFASVAQAAGRATVRGAAAVNVRRAPSANSAAFATLSRGSEVKVLRVVDGWAVIGLESGQEGYVKAAFLDLPAGMQVVTTEPTAPPATPSEAPTETAISAAATAAPEPRAESGGKDGLEREVAQLRNRLTALESAIVSTPGNATPAARGEAGEGAADEAAIGGDATTHAGGALLPTAVRSPESQEVGPSFALAGVGLILGLIIGAAYGRRQERNRRSRVRF